MTFSIVARDAETGDLGCAVASKFPAVGAIVPAVLAGVGAIASQSFVNARYRPDGMALLQSGVSPDAVVRRLTDPDDERAVRQLGIVDAGGSAFSFTGTDCLEWAGLSARGVRSRGTSLRALTSSPPWSQHGWMASVWRWAIVWSARCRRGTEPEATAAAGSPRR